MSMKLITENFEYALESAKSTTVYKSISLKQIIMHTLMLSLLILLFYWLIKLKMETKAKNSWTF